MLVAKENEIIRYNFRYDDYNFKCYSYGGSGADKIKWEAPAYCISETIYDKENGELGGRLKAINAIVVFKNDNTYEDFDRDYIFKVLNEEFKTHKFKDKIEFFYGRMLNNGVIEWGIQVDEDHKPF